MGDNSVTANTNPFEPIGDERDHHGPGEVEGNIDALAKLFPDAVIDGEIDLGVLADLIGQKAERPGTEGFGLRWPGMHEARRLSAQPATQTLLPRPDESVDWDTTKNIVIEGDNLEVLRLLRRGYTGMVDVIYIDPPYNTGNDFVYDDTFTATRAEIETEAGLRDDAGTLEKGAASNLAADRRAGASRHSRWLSMMYPRLLLAHHLLKETGVIMVAIDDTEHARLRLVLDGAFGAENFVANLVWQGGRKNDAQFVSPSTDYMLVYLKNAGALADVKWREQKPGLESIVAAGRKAWRESGQDEAKATSLMKNWWAGLPSADPRRASEHYNQVDGTDGRPGAVYVNGDLRSPNPRPNLRYDVHHPVTKKPANMHPNGWVYEPERMKQFLAEGRIRFGKDESYRPTFKRYLEDTSTQTVLPNFYMDRRASSKRLEALLGADVFTYPKDETVLARWIDLVTRSSRSAVVLDFFAGSGSTGHAVMDLNAADGGTRRHILVQLDESIEKDGYSTIADITRERLRRAGAQIVERRTLDAQDVDTGFRSYRLAESNVRPWDGTGEIDLLSSVDNLAIGRSTDDLLVEMMLRLGIDLATPVETREVVGSTLYSLAGTLYAYFGVEIDSVRAEEVARTIVGWRDEDPVDSEVTVVVRDTGFADSGAKLNLAAALRQAGVTTLRSI